MTTNRLLIVSNRLPVNARVTAGGVRISDSGGGLASGLRAWHERTDALWIGWPGDLSGATPGHLEELERRLGERRIVPVPLSPDQIDRYYHGFSNRVLWPMFHYLIDQLPTDDVGWDAYRDANEKFADVVSSVHRPGDLVWVHDYQLMLLPALLRARLPEARIGFFLHIPFPSSEVFRILPWRREILNGLLGADLIGFHTFAYMRHFMTSLLHVGGLEADIDRVRIGNRESRVNVFPMGVDAQGFAALATDADVVARAEAIRKDAGGRRIVLGIDRLDYTKGIPRRLEAVDQLMQREPALRDAMRYIQVAVPSRGDVDEYRQFRKSVEQRVGRINGAYGSVSSLPVHYIHRSVSQADLVALYTAADVMLVTPLRDGMNLVAKEFVATRGDEGGVLVLSEFAGAAAELNGAITVNPYDVAGVADAIQRALRMAPEERRVRMRNLRQCVVANDVHSWAAAFIDQLENIRPAAPSLSIPVGQSLIGLVRDARRTRPVRLLLDYDGTLVPMARSPELARPDDELVTLLQQLAQLPDVSVDIVSGRPRETLEQWFGDFPIALWGEHGFWYRRRPGDAWVPAVSVAPDWMLRVKPILDRFAAATPGAHVEVKSASIAWHYRGAQRDFGARQVHELRMLLGDVLSNQPLEVLEGRKVLEVRLRGVSKALVARRVQDDMLPDSLIVAVGDDRTDEELFRALPPSSLTVAVGRPWTSATFSLDDFRAVRRLLRAVLDGQPVDECVAVSA
jgi:trehalose 6-phosphate synthase/phosphatase